MPRPTEKPSEGERDPGRLRVVVGREGPVRIVSVAGELDRDTAEDLRTALADSVDEGEERVVVDFTDLQFCDSTGLNLLLRAHLDAEASGLRLELAGLRPMVARLFAVTEADRVLLIHPDLGTALKTAGPAPDASFDTE